MAGGGGWGGVGGGVAEACKGIERPGLDSLGELY